MYADRGVRFEAETVCSRLFARDHLRVDFSRAYEAVVFYMYITLARPPGRVPTRRRRLPACEMSSFPPAVAQVIASTGVKGAVADADTPASGYDGEFNLSNSQDGALYSAFMVRRTDNP